MKKSLNKLLLTFASIALLTSCDPGSPDLTKNVDVDLTVLSSTMVYSEVYHMLTEPVAYEGKVVKMNGVFSIYTNQDYSQYYPTLIIKDATACCAQGIEFVLAGEPSIQEAYPSVGSEATVVGVFETYKEGTTTFVHLVNSKLL